MDLLTGGPHAGRLRLYLFAPELICKVLSTGNIIDGARIKDGLPRDAEIVDMGVALPISKHSGRAYMVVRSDAFDEVFGVHLDGLPVGEILVGTERGQ